MVLKDPSAFKVNLALKVPWVCRDYLAFLEQRARKEILGPKVLLGHLDQLAQWAPRDSQVRREIRDLRAHKVLRELKDHRERSGPQDCQVPRVIKVMPDRRDHKVPLVLLGQLDQWVRKVILVPRDQAASADLKDYKERQVTLDHKVPSVFAVNAEIRDHKAPKVHVARTELSQKLRPLSTLKRPAFQAVPALADNGKHENSIHFTIPMELELH